MQTIKGLAVLVLVAAGLFVVAARNDMKSQAGYAARMHSPALEEMAGSAVATAAGRVKPAAVAAHKTGKVAKVASKTDTHSPKNIPAT